MVRSCVGDQGRVQWLGRVVVIKVGVQWFGCSTVIELDFSNQVRHQRFGHKVVVW